MGKLVVFRADGTAQDIKLDRERITIGRRPDNDVCLTHPAVSGEHAAVVTILADSFLEDLGSTNGTLVNGAAITKYFLRDRDEIDIGRQVLVYLADDAAKLEAPPPPRDRPQDAENGNDEVRASSAGNAANGQHDKRRSDGLAPLAGESVDAIQRFVAAEIESAANNASALHATVDPAESTLSDQSNHWP